MNGKAERVRSVFEGVTAQRDLTVDEARLLDAVITARIDDAVSRADFVSAQLPDFTAVAPDPHRVLADPASRPRLGAHALDGLREVLAHLDEFSIAAGATDRHPMYLRRSRAAPGSAQLDPTRQGGAAGTR